jgi:hypothetical protein
MVPSDHMSKAMWTGKTRENSFEYLRINPIMGLLAIVLTKEM